MKGRLELAVIGTDTGVGKTRVTGVLARGLRLHGRKVWIHKPVACGGWVGGWSDGSAEDGRALAGSVADGQDPATVCPLQFPEAASPHLAAAASGAEITIDRLRANLTRCRGPHDLVMEGVGGLLVPLTTTRATIVDLLVNTGIACVVVTRPDLGTLNHTALTVEALRRRGIQVLGLVLNHHRQQAATPGLAIIHAERELTAITGLPILAVLPHDPQGSSEAIARTLGQAVLAS